MSSVVISIYYKNSETELRGFAPIGMLECWNSGIMGFGLRLRFLPVGLQAGGWSLQLGEDNAMLD